MESRCGACRGSYIWGRSVHNVCIEHLWVDVTAQVGATWANHFTRLELWYGLDINNITHIWLFHFHFLGTINSQCESWNQHHIQICNSLTAHQLTCLSLICLCRDQLLPEEENLIEEELEVYRINWQGLRDDGVLQSQAQNNPRSEGSSSWVGYTGPPDLSEVIVQPPQGTLTADKISHLYDSCSPLLGSAEDADIISLWNHALTHVRVLYPNVF
ncbi:hypothetical protein B0H14DRAFT_2365243 [Mycena olivaceomarginata]|nr:hypothetical protein B0H14DRAFT_2365243 [Mycena olivaceomarginata]